MFFLCFRCELIRFFWGAPCIGLIGARQLIIWWAPTHLVSTMHIINRRTPTNHTFWCAPINYLVCTSHLVCANVFLVGTKSSGARQIIILWAPNRMMRAK